MEVTTVDELIVKLAELPSDTLVWIPDPGCGCCSDGYVAITKITHPKPIMEAWWMDFSQRKELGDRECVSLQ